LQIHARHTEHTKKGEGEVGGEEGQGDKEKEEEKEGKKRGSANFFNTGEKTKLICFVIS
jgi:hypothetical protein